MHLSAWFIHAFWILEYNSYSCDIWSLVSSVEQRAVIFYILSICDLPKITSLGDNAGKELNDPRVLTDVGDVPVQEIRDCGVDDDRLMDVISESVKLVMEQVRLLLLYA